MDSSVFPGSPVTVSNSYEGTWSAEKQPGKQLLVDNVLVGEPVAVTYRNPMIDINTAMQMPNGLVFCFEFNKMTNGIYFCAFRDDKHCTYAQLTEGRTNGLALLSMIVQLAPDALPASVRAALGDGELSKLTDMLRNERIQV